MKISVKRIGKILMAIVFFAAVSILEAEAKHPSLDTLDWWIKVNDGLGKCAPDFNTSGSVLDFKKDDFDVLNTVHRRGLLYINVTYNTGGTVSKDKEGNTFSKNETIELTAIANIGYEFVEWTGDIISNQNPINITIIDNMDIQANFQPIN